MNEERLKRVLELEKAKVVKQSNKEQQDGGGIDQSAIHPSRRARVRDAT